MRDRIAKHKHKITAVAVILAVLAGAWFFGGNYNKSGSSLSPALAQAAESASLSSGPGAAGDPAISAAIPATSGDPAKASETQEAPGTPEAQGASEALAAPEIPGMPETLVAPEITQASEASEAPEATKASEIPEPAKASEAPQAQEKQEAPATPEGSTTPETTQDAYLTDPVPEGKPRPVEPQDVTVGDDSFTVTLSVRCDMILDNMNLLRKEKHELVPADGVIFPETVVTVYEGESVFNILQREMRRARIHMEFRNTPIYNSAYIMGINNLYEFDVGELSGWVYKVNGWFPNYGCSRYRLSQGDVIEWHYTCDLGRDLGEYWLGGRQLDE